MAERDQNASATGRIFITGGDGFVGSNIRSELTGRPIRLLVRETAANSSLASEEVEVVQGDVTDATSLAGAMEGCETVVHLVAIIEETGSQTFDRVIRHGTENVVAGAKRAGVRRLISMSALGASDKPEYAYFYAKWQAEQAVQKSGIPWTIFRPSIIFGPGDGFINQLAGLVKKAPVLPVVGDGNARFQPVSVKEVAESYRRAIDDSDTVNQIFELGGPEILTYEQLIDIIATKLGKKRPKIHVPVGLMKALVALAAPLPKAIRPPVTREQLKMLAGDNCTHSPATVKLSGREQLHLKDGIDYIVDQRQ